MNLILALTGASGIKYGTSLLAHLRAHKQDVKLILSSGAKKVAEAEGEPLPSPEGDLEPGGEALAGKKDAVAAFLKAGGRVLAVGLGQKEAQSFLPIAVTMKDAEHISAFFDPPGAKSPLAGVGPADVHNRAPRTIPLVSCGAAAVGAAAIGDGVLAVASGPDSNDQLVIRSELSLIIGNWFVVETSNENVN